MSFLEVTVISVDCASQKMVNRHPSLFMMFSTGVEYEGSPVRLRPATLVNGSALWNASFRYPLPPNTKQFRLHLLVNRAVGKDKQVGSLEVPIVYFRDMAHHHEWFPLKGRHQFRAQLVIRLIDPSSFTQPRITPFTSVTRPAPTPAATAAAAAAAASASAMQRSQSQYVPTRQAQFYPPLPQQPQSAAVPMGYVVPSSYAAYAASAARAPLQLQSGPAAAAPAPAYAYPAYGYATAPAAAAPVGMPGPQYRIEQAVSASAVAEGKGAAAAAAGPGPAAAQPYGFAYPPAAAPTAPSAAAYPAQQYQQYQQQQQQQQYQQQQQQQQYQQQQYQQYMQQQQQLQQQSYYQQQQQQQAYTSVPVALPAASAPALDSTPAPARQSVTPPPYSSYGLAAGPVSAPPSMPIAAAVAQTQAAGEATRAPTSVTPPPYTGYPLGSSMWIPPVSYAPRALAPVVPTASVPTAAVAAAAPAMPEYAAAAMPAAPALPEYAAAATATAPAPAPAPVAAGALIINPPASPVAASSTTERSVEYSNSNVVSESAIVLNEVPESAPAQAEYSSRAPPARRAYRQPVAM